MGPHHIIVGSWELNPNMNLPMQLFQASRCHILRTHGMRDEHWVVLWSNTIIHVGGNIGIVFLLFLKPTLTNMAHQLIATLKQMYNIVMSYLFHRAYHIGTIWLTCLYLNVWEYFFNIICQNPRVFWIPLVTRCDSLAFSLLTWGIFRRFLELLLPPYLAQH